MDEFGSPPPPKTGLLKRKVPRLVIHFKSQLNSDMSGFTRWTAHQNDMSGEICCLLKHSQQFVSLFCSLIQAHLGSLSVQDFALTQDTGKIFRSAVRISRCENENHSSVCSRQQSHLSDCKKKKKKKKTSVFRQRLAGGPLAASVFQNPAQRGTSGEVLQDQVVGEFQARIKATDWNR